MGYHRGELQVQHRAGLAERAASAGRTIRATVPPVAADFLRAQRLVVLGAADPAGRVWASVRTGPPGFLRAPDERTVTVAAPSAPGDPLAAALDRTTPLGLLAIDPVGRRRMRMNGTAHPDGRGGLRVDLEQVFANCPKYIQRRAVPTGTVGRAGTARRGDRLDPEQQRRLTRADTFFVATTDDAGHTDASHRGGNPGFVQVLSPTRLCWPDYVGNAMFLTLGNLVVDPRAGLVVPDFDTGTTLHLTGTADVVWDPARVAAVPGAQRLVDFTVHEVVELPGMLPAGWGPPEHSRFNP